MDLPTIDAYGSGPNTSRVQIGPVTVWFSYKTPVAFRIGEGPQRVLNYTGSSTTYNHLNLIDGGKRGARLSQEEFQKLWDKEVSVRVKP